MAPQGMHSDPQSYILIPANRLPERVNRAPVIVEDDATLHNIYDRIENHELASSLRGRTMQGDYLMFGTMRQACELSRAIYMEQDRVEAAPQNTNVISILGKTFRSCVDHHTGRALNGMREISSTFCAGAGMAANAPIYNAPKLALAA